jgi:hypothetical protein
MDNLLLANLISIFHIIIVLFMLIAPFSKIPAFLILHIVFSICLFVHWSTNSNICSLTLFEGQFRGIKDIDTLSYQFISPIYDISKTDASNLAWIITFIMLCISVYYLYNNVQFKESMQLYNKINKDLPFTEKIKQIIKCFIPLLNPV